MRYAALSSAHEARAREAAIMTTIIDLTGQGRACEFPGCKAATGYHGDAQLAPAVHEVDGKALCGYHSPYDSVPQSEGIKVGDLVKVRLHKLADPQDCHADPNASYTCTHRHQQVGTVKELSISPVSGPVAVVDFQPLTHRLAGSEITPSGPTTLAVQILERITPFLRGWEILEGIATDRFGYHCSTCGKDMVHVYYRWSNEMDHLVTIDQVNEDHHLDGWRHADGSSYHGEFYVDGSLLPRCQGCGYEGGMHCHQCHEGESLTYRQLAYGDQTDCTTPGCGYSSYYSIGD
jgi:hypothetical protein